jgi:hypothetical protein
VPTAVIRHAAGVALDNVWMSKGLPQLLLVR